MGDEADRHIEQGMMPCGGLGPDPDECDVVCAHCKTPIYLDSRYVWRHVEYISWCRTKAVGPGEKCFCGIDHRE
ncbi:MAG: hypothetical protein GF411_02880 [Candidatus Lokiarchaeota archaeon]|nr:hypothetical protein [Candidatus Lokiarchaeota archaeon]